MLKCNKKILKRLKQKKKGFTLIEIVVALAVIGIMMIPLGGALLTSVKSNKMGEIKQESKLISQEIIEKLRNLGDIQETGTVPLIVGKNQEYKITITQNGDDFELLGVDGDGKTLMSGEIKAREIITDKYEKMQFGTFVYIGKDKTEYIVSRDGDTNKWTIDWYLSEIKTNRGTEIDKNELKVIYDKTKLNKVMINDVENDFIINSIGNIGEPEKKYGDLIIYVELDDDGKIAREDTVKLHLESDFQDYRDIYVVNSKFDDLNNDKDVDIFDKDRFISGDINIIDNITYYENRKHTGLYSIKLNFEKKIPNGTTVTESTQSEFFVTN